MSIIHTSPLPPVVIPDCSITELVLSKADVLANQIAITDGEATHYTFAELKDAIRRLAGGLKARGVGPGTTIGLMAPNIPAYAVVFHGVAMAGAAVTTINPTYGAKEVQFQLRDAGASMLVTTPQFLDIARAAVEGTAVKELVSVGPAASGTLALADLFGAAIDQVSVTYADHVVALPYSSGTTGLPKGVMLTHRNLVANVQQMEHPFQLGKNEAALAALPFFHIYGMQVLMNALLAHGCRVVTMARFDLAKALALVQQERITRFFAVPPIVLALAKSPIVSDYDFSSVRQIFSGAAPLGADLAAEASKRVGCEIVQGYGMTELSPVSHTTPQGGFRPGTSGVTVSNTESRIVDANGHDLGINQPGELWVRGPQVMKGYLNNPEATAATIDADGWLHTGDVAIIDAHHHVTIVDRIKELIKYKGFQVPPAELEALLVTHPKIADAAVIGIADVEAGELPKAFVVPKPGQTVDLAEVQAFMAHHVAAYKQIRLLEVLPAIPKSASGKILRRELRARG